MINAETSFILLPIHCFIDFFRDLGFCFLPNRRQELEDEDDEEVCGELITYEKAPDVQEAASRIVKLLNLDHIDLNRIHFYRSRGSRARRVQARIHGMERIWSEALQIKPAYVIEVLSEEFDMLDREERDKVIIHELLHIPKGFGGGLVPHKNRINRRKVEALYENYQKAINTRTGSTTSEGGNFKTF